MFLRHQLVFVLLLILPGISSQAQISFKGLERLFTEPRNYVSYYTRNPPVIDGDIEEDVWRNAAWSGFFTDIEGEQNGAPAFNTRVKMLWNDSYLFIAAELQDPHVWAKLRQRDQVVFLDNDFEVFIDPDNNAHQYFEIEVNALNTIFDLFLSKPYRNNSGALISWNCPGLKSAVKVSGTLNNPGDTDKGWTVEMAVPFRAVTIGDNVKVPSDGELWRINFSRVEWDTEVRNEKYEKKKALNGRVFPEHNWVWSPQGVVNMHYPERWGYLQFSKKQNATFVLPYSEKQRQYLWLVYYRQKEFFERNKRYAVSLKNLGINPEFELEGKINRLTMFSSMNQFYVSIDSDNTERLEINEDGLVRVIKSKS